MKQALCAEAVGTLFLVMTVVGSGIMADQLSGGIDGLALIGNTLATGAMLVVLITILGPVSGAHFNPAVTFTLCLAREISAPLALGYILSQICGGLAGTILAHLMFDLPLVQIATTNRASLPLYCAEFIATAGLLFVILIGRAFRPSSLPLLVGLYISAGYWFTSSTSFAKLWPGCSQIVFLALPHLLFCFSLSSSCWQLGLSINFQPGLPLHRILTIRARN